MPRSRKAFHFDLSVKKLEANGAPKDAWAKIGKFLENNGFEHIQGSGYESTRTMTHLHGFRNILGNGCQVILCHLVRVYLLKRDDGAARLLIGLHGSDLTGRSLVGRAVDVHRRDERDVVGTGLGDLHGYLLVGGDGSVEVHLAVCALDLRDDGRGCVGIPSLGLHLKEEHHVLLLIAHLLGHRRSVQPYSPSGMCKRIAAATDEERGTDKPGTSRADLLAGKLASEEYKRLLSVLLFCRIHNLQDFGGLVRRVPLILIAVVFKHLAVFLHFCQSFLSHKKFSRSLSIHITGRSLHQHTP